MLVISNPLAGAGRGPEFIELHVLPLLDDLEVELATTQAIGDAALKAIDYVKSRSEAVIVVGGGDGTLHEVINGLAQLEDVRDGSKAIQIVLLPLGTANALYSSLFPPSAHKELEVTHPAYKLLSLRSYLDHLIDASRSKRVPLAVQYSTFLDPNGDEVSNTLSVVVTSTSLHASILNTADRLKKEQPDLVGVERFKVAAMENITNWYHSTVELKPFENSKGCLKYNPSIQQFEAYNGIALDGPFEYFLSVVNVDRLEPDFCIAPLHSRLPSSAGSQSYMDVVIIRPFHHPKLREGEDNEESRRMFVEISTAALKHAYRNGAHVDLRYTEDGAFSLERGGEPVVEYFRCGGWEWFPKLGDELAKLVCADGTIVSTPSGGKVVCKLLTGKEKGIKISVWA